MIQSNPAIDPLIKDIVSRIEFRLIPQSIPWSASFKFEQQDNVLREIDVVNTHIHDAHTPLMNIDFLKTPRLSTLAIAYIINRLVHAMPSEEMYLNIGVWCGFSFFAGILGNEQKFCRGVDNFSGDIVNLGNETIKNIFIIQNNIFHTPRSTFYEVDYETYFQNTHSGPIGVYFYDGDHRPEHTVRGLDLAEPFLAKNAYVLMDDTNDRDVYSITMDFLSNSKETYALVFDEKTPTVGHPTFWNGLLICKKIS